MLRAISPAAAALQRMDDPGKHPAIVDTPSAAQPRRQQRLDPGPLIIRKPKEIRLANASSQAALNHTPTEMGILLLGPNPSLIYVDKNGKMDAAQNDRAASLAKPAQRLSRPSISLSRFAARRSTPAAGSTARSKRPARAVGHIVASGVRRRRHPRRRNRARLADTRAGKLVLVLALDRIADYYRIR